MDERDTDTFNFHILFNILKYAFLINPISTVHQFCTTSIVLLDLHDLDLAHYRFAYCDHECALAPKIQSYDYRKHQSASNDDRPAD
jgi:hypothetical protein